MSQNYQRVVLKLSGESFAQEGQLGIAPEQLAHIAAEIADAYRAVNGLKLAIVVGGGNIVRGAKLAEKGRIAQATADYMGMMGTIINGLALREALEGTGVASRLMTALEVKSVAEPFIRARALRHMEKGRVIILAAGTGNPFFTTDTCASLRGVELQAQMLLKATKVDGIYDKDPKKYPDAVKYDTLTFIEALKQRLNVMDSTAFSLCLDNNVPILVFDLNDEHAIRKAIIGEKIGTLVKN